MIKPKQPLVVSFLVVQWAAALTLKAQTATNNEAEIQALRQEIQQMEQKLDTLEHQQQEEQRKQEEVQEAQTNAFKNSALLTVGANGANFTSANSNFVFALHGWIQVDSRTFFDNEKAAGIDGFLLRRARPIFQGTLFHDYDFMFVPEFAGSGAPQILDAYINYSRIPELQFEIGKFKPPLGLEALEPDIYTFLNERSLATDLVPYRSIGVELHGDLSGGVFSYAAGIFNGLPDYTTTTINANYDNDVAFAGRLFTMPFKATSLSPLQGLGFGVSGSYERDQTNAAAAGLTPGYTTDGQQKFFAYSSTVPDGAHWRISPQGYYYYGPFGIMAEYVISDQQVEKISAPVATDDLHNTAWEVSGGWVLTGEQASYSGVIPRRPFGIRSGGWGAWQIVGRYEELHVDSGAFPTYASPATSASDAHAWSAGLNWYLNNDLRANVSFSRTVFTGGGGGTVTGQSENVLFTRMQLAF